MKYSSLFIIGTIFLSACTSQPPGMMNGMQHGNGMMGSNRAHASGFLPGQGMDISTLPEVKPSATIDVQNGQTISLNPTLVRKAVNGKEFAMYGYNGQIPGPLLKVKQGATFAVSVTNNIDLPTTIHWHGLRLDSQFDGTAGVSQKEIAPGDSFTYTVKVPDDGIYWYHTHVREDVQQPMGLYGNILVTPGDAQAYPPVNREDVVVMNDILLDEDGSPMPYGAEEADHALMGRFGNALQMNGKPAYELNVQKGDVARFYITNAANTRTFRVRFQKSSSAQNALKMKLVGGDNGRYEKETYVEAITLAPSERAIAEVLFPETGIYDIIHEPSLTSPRHPRLFLGHIYVSDTSANVSYAGEFNTLRTNAGVIAGIDAFRSSFDKTPDHTLILDMSMMGGGMMADVPKDGIEWEDSLGMMNSNMMSRMMKWKMIDQETGVANDKLVYTARVGDKVKIRIINKKDSPHPMQHPIHFHGQRFLVLSDNGVKNTNFVWKDTTLVPAGHTVDILLDVSNPGDWMFHCHIAEHLGNGMMGLLRVLP